ncbi:MAG: endonuclease III, partial [Armatimonadetes bacterium]|nr:endonuclease III [Armatimonadota bacterium]
MNAEQIAPALDEVEAAVQPYAPAALFTLATEGYQTLFEILIACIVSVRTLEEDTLAVSRRLFSIARTPADIAALADDELIALLEGSTFPKPKVQQIKGIAERAEREFNGVLPADYDALLSFHGVGAKCASLALGVATGETPHTPVDTHVHRVVNRWGVVDTKTPEKTMITLDAVLTESDRVRINRLLVPFGKH